MAAGGGAGGDAARWSIATDMMWRTTADREPLDDVARLPRPGPRPTARAQWDEVHGCWIEWDEHDHLWVHVDHPIVRSAGPATDPPPDPEP